MNLQLDLLEELAESLETLLEEIYEQEDLEEAEGFIPPPESSLLEKLHYLVQTRQVSQQQALRFLSLYLNSSQGEFSVPQHLHPLAQQLHLMDLDEDRMRVQ